MDAISILAKLETIFGKRLNRYGDSWEFQIFPNRHSFYLEIEFVAYNYIVSIKERLSVYDRENFCYQTENKRLYTVSSKEEEVFQKIVGVLDLLQKDLESKVNRISEINGLLPKL